MSDARSKLVVEVEPGASLGIEVESKEGVKSEVKVDSEIGVSPKIEAITAFPSETTDEALLVATSEELIFPLTHTVKKKRQAIRAKRIFMFDTILFI